MWQVVCLFVLSLILSGAFGAMGAEADAKAYEFIIPDVDIEYLSSADIQDMPLQVVCYAKNEIYARHGRMFQSQELTNYFEEQLWYYGCISPSEFSSSVLNVYETANIKLLSDRESALRSGGYVLDQPGYDFMTGPHRKRTGRFSPKFPGSHSERFRYLRCHWKARREYKGIFHS